LFIFSKEFQRLTDRIEILTKARDALTEHIHEVDDTAFPYSSSINDVSSIHSPSQHSPLDKPTSQRKSSLSPIQSNSKDIYINDYSTPNDQQTSYPFYPLTPPISTQQTIYFNQRSRSPSMTPSNFIRVHFPNKHTTAVCQLDISYVPVF
jgi:hypothetical protein